MNNNKVTNNTRQVVNRAWMRDGSNIYTGQALLLAMLIHSQGTDRNSEDGELVRKIMKDHNL